MLYLGDSNPLLLRLQFCVALLRLIPVFRLFYNNNYLIQCRHKLRNQREICNHLILLNLDLKCIRQDILEVSMFLEDNNDFKDIRCMMMHLNLNKFLLDMLCSLSSLLVNKFLLRMFFEMNFPADNNILCCRGLIYRQGNNIR